MATTAGAAGTTLRGPRVERQDDVLTPEALAFLAQLQRRFGARRQELLVRRGQRREQAARSGRLDFPETREIREDASWLVAPAPADLIDRRVEITGPTDRKMLVNAMGSGARVWRPTSRTPTRRPGPTWSAGR